MEILNISGCSNVDHIYPITFLKKTLLKSVGGEVKNLSWFLYYNKISRTVICVIFSMELPISYFKAIVYYIRTQSCLKPHVDESNAIIFVHSVEYSIAFLY